MSTAVLQRFYSAFAQRDWSTMGACYAEDARFSDPVFPDLDAPGVRAMWKMLLTSGTDLRITFHVIEEHATGGVCEWEAFYTFNRTGRKVHNIIRSTFVLRDGLIVRQQDDFNFWRWSHQALGTSGALLGWSPLVKNKVRGIAASGLRKAMREANK
jgi:ketosteroid isomerase-like protein